MQKSFATYGCCHPCFYNIGSFFKLERVNNPPIPLIMILARGNLILLIMIIITFIHVFGEITLGGGDKKLLYIQYDILK